MIKSKRKKSVIDIIVDRTYIWAYSQNRVVSTGEFLGRFYRLFNGYLSGEFKIDEI